MHPSNPIKPTVFALVFLLAAGVAVDARAAQGSTFDHFTTGYRLDGAHAMASCDSCHAGSLFAGTPTECAGCHSDSSTVRASTQPSHHVTATQQCESCHRPYTWVPVVRVDHLEVLGSCGSCHDGRRAGGQPLNHLPTANDCESCHRTGAWSPAQFNHTGITDGCFSCHNSMLVMGKPMDHIPATNLCESCHRTIAWSPVGMVDHLQVLGSCSTCHNGVIATGQHAAHMQTTAECDNCHNTRGWR